MRIAIDIGGTFTDATALDETTGEVRVGKALSTPSDLVDGMLAAVRHAGVEAGEASSIIHGSTVVINALLERKGARTALVTTRGFRDVYEIGRINRPDAYNLAFRKHRPLVPRELIFEADERVLADGTVERPLDVEQARRIAADLRRLEIEAVGVVFLHSYRAPAHEEQMKAVLEQELGGAFVTTSSELSGEYREFERTSTVAANAYVGPRVSTYLGALESRLAGEDFTGDLQIMQSNGGLSDVALARRQCVQMTESGPAGGVVGSLSVCEQLGIDAAICFDMGGTTAKACVIRRGVPDLCPDYFVGGYAEGLVIRIPVLDIQEVGTGGGSIAWIDAGGGLHVGPESAGSVPGPVCYGRGGERPAITDADVTLGWISPERFMGGEMPLDGKAAAAAIESVIARPLGITLARAASGMVAIAVASMANAVRSVTTQRGLDPRDFTLIAYGGAGPPHAVAVARELAITRVLIPNSPAHFSAFGMMAADRRRDLVLTRLVRLAGADLEELEQVYRDLAEQAARDVLARGGSAGDVVIERAADMRYVGQEHAVAVPVPADLTPAGVREHLKRTFDDLHERRFSHGAPEEPAEIVTLRVSAIQRVVKPAVRSLEAGSAAPAESARRPSRPIRFLGADDAREAPVFDRTQLLAGNRVEGPAIIEEPASTTVLHAGDSLLVTPQGHLLIEVAAS